jgi:predicted RNase H-like nuclease (RuvC/YqgF family)
MMTDPTDLGERAITAAQNFIRKGQEAAKRETRILRLQTQVSRLRSQRQRLFSEMGQKVFDLFERDLVKNQDLRMMCQQIRTLDAEVAMRREEIEQLRRPDAGTVHGVDEESDADVVEEEDEIIRD